MASATSLVRGLGNRAVLSNESTAPIDACEIAKTAIAQRPIANTPTADTPAAGEQKERRPGKRWTATQPPSTDISGGALLEGRHFDLGVVPRTEPVGLVRRRRLIAGRRRGQVVARRLGDEGAGLGLVGSRGRENMLLNKPLEPSSVGRSGREASASASAVTVPPAWVLERPALQLVAGQRARLGLRGLGRGPVGLLLLGGVQLALLDVGILGPGGLLAAAASLCGGGRLRLGGTTSGARSRYSMSSPSCLRPKSFRNWRMILVSSGTSSSSSSAKALPALHAMASAIGQRQGAGRRQPCSRRCLFEFPFRMGYPLQATAEYVASPSATSGQDQGAFAASPPVTVSYKSPMTPATMATSARLKTYHLKLKSPVVTWNSTKSATAP